MKLSMIIRYIAFCLVALLTTVQVPGQGKKTISSMGIVSVTVQEYFIEEGMDQPVVESIEKYNEEGELVELKEFNKRGEVRKWEKYGFDGDGNLVEEIFLDEKGKVERTEKNLYRDGLRVEKEYYDDKGRLTKRKVYQYEYREVRKENPER